MSKTLVIDIGNTKSKAAVFEGMELIELKDDCQFNDIIHLISTHQIEHSLLSSVKNDNQALVDMVRKSCELKLLTHATSLPFENNYATPHTLGMDRIAGIAGAYHYYPDQPCLVIDIGTCITYDVIDANAVYQGGAISPGLHMRLKAMNAFTDKLPMVEFDGEPDLIGKSTDSCMSSGAFNGMIGEINHTIARYSEIFPQLQVIICGGDTALFGKHIKNNIFAAPNLVLYGLNKILLFNV